MDCLEDYLYIYSCLSALGNVKLDALQRVDFGEHTHLTLSELETVELPTCLIAHILNKFLNCFQRLFVR